MSYKRDELDIFSDRELLQIMRDALKAGREEMSRRKIWRVYSQDKLYGKLQPVWSPELRKFYRLIEDVLTPLDALLERLIENEKVNS